MHSITSQEAPRCAVNALLCRACSALHEAVLAVSDQLPTPHTPHRTAAMKPQGSLKHLVALSRTKRREQARYVDKYISK